MSNPAQSGLGGFRSVNLVVHCTVTSGRRRRVPSAGTRPGLEMPNGTKVVPAPAATDALRAGTGAEASSEPEVDPLTHYVRERRVRANPCKVDGGRVWSNDDMVVICASESAL